MGGARAYFVAICGCMALVATPAHAGDWREGIPDVDLELGVYTGNTFTFGKFAGLGATNGPDAAATDAALVQAAQGRSFQVHLYADWRGGVPASLVADIDRHVANGLKVNLALKYVPPDGRDGDVAGFTEWVRTTVAALPQVSVWQITNEANVFFSPDSDGGSSDAVGALVEGVLAADEAAAPGQDVGFNWFYKLGPVHDRKFWADIGARGGAAFAAALDYVGIDIYEGTYIPPLVSVSHEHQFRSALRELRRDLMPLAGLPQTLPIYVQETGWPTLGPVRSEAEQARALAGYLRATRGMGVGLLMWFQLADAVSPLGDGWGLLRADFTPKPAWAVLERAVRGDY